MGWVKNYLGDRKQFVQIGECLSDLINIECGVPQGSVLGHIFFILYINYICNVSYNFLSLYYLQMTQIYILYSDEDVHE